MNEEQCRICLNITECPIKLSYQIAEQPIYEIINSISSTVSISVDDHFPQQLCRTCADRITDIVAFRLEIERSNEVLQGNGDDSK